MELLSNIEDHINTEVESQVSSVRDHNKELLERLKVKSGEIKTLELKLKGKDKLDVLSRISRKLKEEDIVKMIDIFYTPTNNVGFGFQDGSKNGKITNWFNLLVKYWDDKEDIIEVLDLYEVRYNKNWVEKTMKMPYEWSKEECLHFIKTIHHHYVCNNCIFQSNINFWSSEAIGKTPKENMNKSYSDIPWQFVLKNPLFLNDNDVFEEMIECISGGSSHSKYFYALTEYQSFPKKRVLKFVKALMSSCKTDYDKRSARSSIGRVMPLISSKSKIWNSLWEDLGIKDLSRYPDDFKVGKLMSMEVDDASLRNILRYKDVLTKDDLDCIFEAYKTYKLSRS